MQNLIDIQRLARRISAISLLGQDGNIGEIGSESIDEILTIQIEAANQIANLAKTEIQYKNKERY